MPKCKYCEVQITSGTICSACSAKRVLVRKLIEMCEPYKAIIERRKERNAKEKEQAL